ncbi:MAG: CinA family nicotinamide mononucleotide deamidase-related protein [Syntrophotaleaceae bacterium]
MALSIAVLTTGDELINGEMADTNTREIARILGAKGYAIRESRSVGDDEAEIEQALVDLSAKRDVVIVTGGLGPTEDDLTARAASRAFGRRLVLNDVALRQVRDFFHRNSLEMNPRNEKQALLPTKSAVIPNLLGTAPGFTFIQGKSELFFLPGVPREMVAMLELEVLPRLQARDGGQLMQERILKVFGLAEPQVEEMLASQPLQKGVLLGFGVDFPFVHVKLRATGEEAEQMLDQAEVAARHLLEPYVFGLGEETLPGNVARMLTNAGLTIALAESCTGGMIAAMLTDFPGASAFLERGAVTYANSAKRDWLGVPDDILEKEGAVSEACALAMARGIREAAGTDLGLAVTGIAGPEGGTAQKPVGTVFLALCGADVEQSRGFRFSGDREKVRRMSACMALDWIRRYLNSRMI